MAGAGAQKCIQHTQSHIWINKLLFQTENTHPFPHPQKAKPNYPLLSITLSSTPENGRDFRDHCFNPLLIKIKKLGSKVRKPAQFHPARLTKRAQVLRYKISTNRDII